MALSTLVEETECSGACFFLQIVYPPFQGLAATRVAWAVLITANTFPQPGNGPGAGTACCNIAGPHGGTFTGNQFLVPLVGGSGGGGGQTGFPGQWMRFLSRQWRWRWGGALLLASSTSITVNGTITANGGKSVSPNKRDCRRR